MELLFWLLAGIIGYTYFGYPLIILGISLFVNNPVKKEAIEPEVTFLITAYNEEKDIRQKLENTLNLDYPKEKIEILVASDGSDDRTEDIVREFERMGVKLYRVEGRVGKTEVQNHALQVARGEIIIFSDATTNYERHAVRNIVRNYADPRVGAVSGRFKYIDPDKTQIGIGTRAFWDYESFIKMKQTRIKTITGCSGCIYSVRKNLYVPLPHDIISDLVEPLKILEKGYRIVYEPAAFAYEVPCKKCDDEFTMRIRVISRGMRGICYMRNLLDPLRYRFVSFQLISHKILRWMIPFFALALYIATAVLMNDSPFYLAMFTLQSLFYILASLGWLMELSNKKVHVFSIPFYFCVVNIASVAALLRLIRRKKDIRWETIRS